MNAKPEAKVSIPDDSAGSPKLVRLGTIVAVCFVAGALWPRLAGFTLVPRAPGAEPEAPAAVPANSASAAASSATEQATPEPAPEEAAAEPEHTQAETISISKAVVVSCRDDSGRKRDTCDTPDVDELVTPKVHALAGCDAAQDAEGTLSLGVAFDFASGKVGEISSGKSTTLKKPIVEQLLRCARKEFETASLKDISHENSTYQIFYLVELTPPGTPVSKEVPAEQEVEASGSGVVMWESAIVRDKPGKDSTVVARVLYGARLVVQARQGEWYKVKYDGRGRTGWIHQNAIGKK